MTVVRLLCCKPLRKVGLRIFRAGPSRLLSTQTKCDETHKVFRPEPSFTKNLMEIGTRRVSSEEHDTFRQSVRRFFEAEVLPYHSQPRDPSLPVPSTQHHPSQTGCLFLLNSNIITPHLSMNISLTHSSFLHKERLLIADMALANCEFMFEETRKYVRQRKAFGKTVADLQTVQHKLAEIKTQTCVGRAFVDSCLQLHKERRLDSATASMAKYWASEQQTNVANQCVQLHGGWGYMWEYPIAKSFVDSRVQPIYGGTNEIMKELIA
ncbi:long-chain specific acyl-CoA dehydrogenase, mitochondrial [Rhincodon typus]|uniref:long-chain specific acyl-CoA dehydrogenase, mitochondrial n=1 Tax=Rhincodon typus TaxID=259920 RepID=UPI0020302A8C|nr:long-chain specific acyl-CoA dehydrogenase, mitochondrial [Rhincodon typus]